MKTTPRLYLEETLGAGRDVALNREQTHYLTGVLRLEQGDRIHVFNSRDGEWLAELGNVSKKSASIRCNVHLSDSKPTPDIDFLFAPLKHARLDYMVQKATELGVRRLQPVITARTIVERVNLQRMRANAIEAAEQCNLVFVPRIDEPRKLEKMLAKWEKSRALVYCDEAAHAENPLAALRGLKTPAAILIGPEGGFTEAERALLKSHEFVKAISLGPRIMRADTAAVAVLSLVQATLGDWHQES